MKREYRDHQGREWFALHVRTGEERDVALAVYGLGDADSLLPVEHYTTRGQERERILMPGYVFVGCVMNADMWQTAAFARRAAHPRRTLRGNPGGADDGGHGAILARRTGDAGSPAKRRDRSGRRTAAGSDAYDHLRDARQGVITVALDLPGGMREVTMHATFRPEAGGTSEENFI
ncbi:MAG: transcription termination/antitermination NusG family protein [Christensenellales bacterium]